MRSKKNKRLGFLTGVGTGAALMYVFDPISGTRRRSMARDQLTHAECALSHELEKARRDLGHRGQGLLVRAWQHLQSLFVTPRIDGDTLIARVRSELGRVSTHPRAVHVSAAAGYIVLHGQILEDEAETLIQRIGRVRGVRGVEDRLERYTSADNIPSLQGTNFRNGRSRSIIFQEEWPPAFRLLAGAIGTYYGLKGLFRGGLIGKTMALGCGLIAARAVTNMPARRMLGIGAGYRAIDLQKTLTVHAPLEEVFESMTRIENFPRIMQHVEEVRRIGDKISHWKVRGPAGKLIEWDAQVTQLVPNELFAWRTLPGSMVEHEGRIRFLPQDTGRTRLDIHMSYNPPAGALGHALASLMRVDAKTALDEDLVRLKSLLENGKARAHHHVVTYDELAATPRD